MNKKFLLADDCAINRFVIKIILEKYKYDIVEASNGQEVLNFIENGNIFDIILMDIQMPIIDGIECTKILRNKLNYEGIIIGVTAHIDNETYDKCIEHGINEILAKPVTNDRIYYVTQKYLNKT